MVRHIVCDLWLGTRQLVRAEATQGAYRNSVTLPRERNIMHQRVLAFDFDGTLAENGIVPQALQKALERLRTAAYALFLVTGRRYESIALGSFGDVFTGIVWENGAVLSHAAANQVSLAVGTLNPCLIQALEAA